MAQTKLVSTDIASVPATALPTFTSTDPGAVPASGGGTTNFLRADGTWDAPGGGGGGGLSQQQILARISMRV